MATARSSANHGAAIGSGGLDCDESFQAFYPDRDRLGSLVRRCAFIMDNNGTCVDNCSGRGDCYAGTCWCQVQYSGGSCTDPNLNYYIAFSTIFYGICAISLTQLVVSMRADYYRCKAPSLGAAFRVTAQKVLYVLVCLATFLRGFYFSSPDHASLQWASSLFTAYYPLLLSGSSVIVCLWAEMFHVRDTRPPDQRGFLNKSFLGFVAFNIITYSLLVAELVVLQYADYFQVERTYLYSVFNGLFAFLMVVVVIVFLAYGVEVYFRVRGAFLQSPGPPQYTDMSQVHQSRLGCVAFAILTVGTVVFLVSDILGDLWRDKVPVTSRNFHDVMFRVVEMGLALWFPCVLWNCVQPQQLWILNPRRLVTIPGKDGASKLQPHQQDLDRVYATIGSAMEYEETLFWLGNSPSRGECSGSNVSLPECFICYDSDRKDAGPLINACKCRGDVSVVHHDCLRTWLMECAVNGERSSTSMTHCGVCGEPYRLERGAVWLPAALTWRHYLHTAILIVAAASIATAASLVVALYNTVAIRTIAVGAALIGEYMCLRLYGVSALAAYKRARYQAVRILGKRLTANAPKDLQAKLVPGPHAAGNTVIVHSTGHIVADVAPVHVSKSPKKSEIHDHMLQPCTSSCSAHDIPLNDIVT